MDFSGNDNNKEMFTIFQGEAEEIIERLFNNLYALEKTPANKELIASVYRDLHSIKGAVKMVGFNNIQSIFHKMEDIFDAVNNEKFTLDNETINLMSKTLETASRYLQESIKNCREIIDEEFTATISNLEYILEIEINEHVFHQNETAASIADIADMTEGSSRPDITAARQEEINSSFNNCFEIIDGIVPEEESQDIVLLREEVQKIHDFFADSNLYEVRASLENIIAKIE